MEPNLQKKNIKKVDDKNEGLSLSSFNVVYLHIVQSVQYKKVVIKGLVKTSWRQCSRSPQVSLSLKLKDNKYLGFFSFAKIGILF